MYPPRELNLRSMSSEGHFSGALMIALMALLWKSIIPNGSERRDSGAPAFLGGVYYSNYAAVLGSSVGVWYILTKQMSCLSPLAYSARVRSPGFYLFRLSAAVRMMRLPRQQSAQVARRWMHMQNSRMTFCSLAAIQNRRR